MAQTKKQEEEIKKTKNKNHLKIIIKMFICLI